ncbi:hypothetical protein EXIGLDRAFT_763315, partial [Exidia glandulosa HHB12029]
MADTDMRTIALSAEQLAEFTPEQASSLTQDEIARIAPLTPEQIRELIAQQMAQHTPPAQPEQQGTAQPGPPQPPAPPAQPPQPAQPTGQTTGQTTGPLNPAVRPTAAQLASEANRKRKRDGADDDTGRVEAIRALVRRADNEHLQDAIIPYEDRPVAETQTAYHVDNWKADTEPVVAKSLPKFDVKPQGVLFENLFTYNKSATAWLRILRESAADRKSGKGFASVITLMDYNLKRDEIPAVREKLQEGLSRKTHSKGWVIISPQPTDDWRDGSASQTSPSFLALGSLEATLALAAERAHALSWDTCPDPICFVVTAANNAPPSLVGSYVEIPGLPQITPQIEADFLRRFRAHVANRFPKNIDDFLRDNGARVWGGGQLEPWWSELAQESIRIRIWQMPGRDKQLETTISVYCLVEGCRVYTLHPTLRTIKKNNILQV